MADLEPEQFADYVAPYYEQDGVTIYHGDAAAVLPALSVEADLLLTDPPYGISHQSNHGAMPGIVGDDGTLDVLAIIKNACRLLRIHRHLYVFGPLDLGTITVGATAELIWDKGKPGMGNLSIPWGPSHERIAFAVWSPYPSQKGDGRVAAKLRQGTVIRSPKINNGRGALSHPTAKPVPLMRLLIESSSTFDDLVLDPFMGRGSTLVAAKLEGRRAIGIEVDERYCEMAARRLSREVLDLGGVA